MTYFIIKVILTITFVYAYNKFLNKMNGQTRKITNGKYFNREFPPTFTNKL